MGSVDHAHRGPISLFATTVLTSLIAPGRRRCNLAYEDRIAELRAQVDRMTSRQLLDQEQVEHKLDQILRRQTVPWSSVQTR